MRERCGDLGRTERRPNQASRTARTKRTTASGIRFATPAFQRKLLPLPSSSTRDSSRPKAACGGIHSEPRHNRSHRCRAAANSNSYCPTVQEPGLAVHGLLRASPANFWRCRPAVYPSQAVQGLEARKAPRPRLGNWSLETDPRISLAGAPQRSPKGEQLLSTPRIHRNSHRCAEAVQSLDLGESNG